MHRRQSHAHGQDVDASPIGVHERVRTKVKCIHALPERLERRCNVLRLPDFGWSDLNAELAGRCLGLTHFQYRSPITGEVRSWHFSDSGGVRLESAKWATADIDQATATNRDFRSTRSIRPNDMDCYSVRATVTEFLYA